MKKPSIKTLVILWVWGITTLLFVLLLSLQFEYSKRTVLSELEKDARSFTSYYALKFAAELDKAAVIPQVTSVYLENRLGKLNELELKNYLKNLLLSNHFVYGSAIAFEPYAFNPKKKLFAPYCYLKAGKPVFVQLGTESYNYLSADWYSLPKAKKQALWSEPYFDRGGGNTLMITYSAPFFRGKKLQGITTVDISLQKLTGEIKNIKVLKSGYAFILSQKGHLLCFPDESCILKNKLSDLNRELGEKISTEETGFMATLDPLTQKKVWVAFKAITNAGFSFAVVFPEKEALADLYRLEQKTTLIGAVGLLLLLLVIILFSSSITQPLVKLAEAVKIIARGNLEQKIEVFPHTSEVLTLQSAFNQMTEDLKKYLAENQKITREQERILSELEIAKQIQLAAVPQVFPPFPERKELEIFARILPAREVGGDFYDFFFLNPESFCFAIGDASGKGIPAALFVALSQAYLKASAQLKCTDPAECLQFVNDLLCQEHFREMFITVFYGTLNTRNGELLYCNAGHNPPYLIQDDGKGESETLLLPISGDPALGVEKSARYNSYKLKLEGGIFLYTDGVIDAVNQEHQRFSDQKLYSLLKGMQDFYPQAAVEKVLKELEKYTKGATQADDITLLAIQYLPPT